jgi:CelD/BcsL family acetyltransferase involved in cellulose biosynthesis
VGGRLSDFQALIAPASLAIEPRALLRACGLKAWHFDHLLAGQSDFAPFAWRVAESPFVDLSGGIQTYFARRSNDTRLRAEFRRKARMLARDVGPLRFVENVDDRSILDTVIQWKSAQFQRSGIPNIFDYSWVHALLEHIRRCASADFSCHMSALYAGRTIVAAHFGMRSGPVLHLWFPVYNVELPRYSPGYLHSIEMIEAAASAGVRRIDLGKGPEAYKRRLMSGITPVAEGAIDLRPAVAALSRSWRSTRDRLRQSRLAAPMRTPVRMARRARHWLKSRLENFATPT